MTTTIARNGGPVTFTLGDLLKKPIPPREYLLDGLIREGESMMLWAAPGVGKTMAALSMALAIAGGGQFLAWKAPKPRKVLYIDGEMHLADLQERLRGLAAAIPALDMEAAGRNLEILARQAQKPDAYFPDLVDEHGQQFVFDKATGENFALVILDNFSVLADVSDENDAAAMGPVLTFLMRMKQGSAATILLHHSSKGGDNYRGSSKLATTFEVIAGLAAATGAESRHSSAFDMKFGKFRGKRNETIEVTTAWLEETSGGGLAWAHKPSEDGRLHHLVDAVRSCEFATQKELASALKVSAGKLSGMKAKVFAKGLMKEVEWDDCLSAARDSVADTDGDEEENSPF